MVTYLLNFHENIKFSKTVSEYHEQPYPLEKTTAVFFDPPKKMQITFVGYSWNNQGIFLNSIFPEHYFGIFPWFHWEYFPNIPGIPHGNVPRIFHGHIFAWWIISRLECSFFKPWLVGSSKTRWRSRLSSIAHIDDDQGLSSIVHNGSLIFQSTNITHLLSVVVIVENASLILSTACILHHWLMTNGN